MCSSVSVRVPSVCSRGAPAIRQPAFATSASKWGRPGRTRRESATLVWFGSFAPADRHLAMPIDAAEWLAQNASAHSVQPSSRAGAPVGRRDARLVAIVNSHAGACRAQQLWARVVLPLLDYALPSDVTFDGTVRRTESAGDGERIGRELRRPVPAADAEEQRLVLLVLGGDGTVHEVLNGLLLDEAGREHEPRGQPVELVLM